MKKFYGVIGNPPYQEEQAGDNKQFAPPIYHHFIDESQKVSERVELIHPARFLFRAGSTPKAWNEKMLADPHLEVVDYQADASSVFGPAVEIKGGVAVTYWDSSRDFGSIGTFSAYPELNTVMKKAAPSSEEDSLAAIIYVQNRFDLDALYGEHPEYRNVIGSGGNDKRFRNNIFDKIPEFTEAARAANDIPVYGVMSNRRVWRYLPRRYFDLSHENISKWKVLVARVNGSGSFGEVLSTPLIEEPMKGYTQSFIGVGSFESADEAEAALRYIKSKFARAMLGILKITQDNNRSAWTKIPLQDFTSSSDIDWSQGVADIDRQLYAKYGLSDDEIAFIESHVKEMG